MSASIFSLFGTRILRDGREADENRFHHFFSVRGLFMARIIRFASIKYLSERRFYAETPFATFRYKGRLRWKEVFADGTCSSKNGGNRRKDAHRGKGTKLMVAADGQGIPLGTELTGATPHKITLIEKTLDTTGVPRSGRGVPRKRFPRSLLRSGGRESVTS
jgi:hypothetical protein